MSFERHVVVVVAAIVVTPVIVRMSSLPARKLLHAGLPRHSFDEGASASPHCPLTPVVALHWRSLRACFVDQCRALVSHRGLTGLPPSRAQHPIEPLGKSAVALCPLVTTDESRTGRGTAGWPHCSPHTTRLWVQAGLALGVVTGAVLEWCWRGGASDKDCARTHERRAQAALPKLKQRCVGAEYPRPLHPMRPLHPLHAVAVALWSSSAAPSSVGGSGSLDRPGTGSGPSGALSKRLDRQWLLLRIPIPREWAF